ncbi:MAG: GNAT family N-acetyltransferase [Candidatus Heimdallarchaeota archaeon]|nr:MAG: GNAT family N-acetyltransferase [Candidatus Heimdallarchaeota archaeon]
MVILIPNSQFDSIRYIFDSNQQMRNVIEAIPRLTTGKLWVDNLDNPSMALYSIPGINFLAGTPDPQNIDDLLGKIPSKENIFIPTTKWIEILKQYFGIKLGTFNRYALSATSLRLKNIRNLKEKLPRGFYFLDVDTSILNQIKDSIGFFIHLFFGDPESFMISGRGYCIKHDDTVISIASSLVPYTKSLEIQVDTIDSPKYRRKGFATRVAAEMIEYCLENGIEPHWDADTIISRDFALKLGYTNPQSYSCYYWV